MCFILALSIFLVSFLTCLYLFLVTVSLCVVFIKSILVNTETLVKRAQCLRVTPEVKAAALFGRKGSLVDSQGV